MNLLIISIFLTMSMVAVGITLLGVVINSQTELIKNTNNVTNYTNQLVTVISNGVASPQAEQMYKHQTVMLEQILDILRNNTAG